MRALCSVALKTVLLCAYFSSVLFAREDGETIEPTEKKPLVFNGSYFEKLSKPLSEDLIYNKGVFLERNAVTQSMDIVENGDIYHVQIVGSSQHQLNALRGAPNATNPSECMVFGFFGHGTSMAVEKAADGTYIWLGSHSSEGNDKSYGSSQTICHVKYEPGTSVQLAGGDVFHLKSTHDIHLAINVEKDLLGIQCSKRMSGVSTRVFVAYRLSEVMRLAPMDVVLEPLKYDGEDEATPEKTVMLTVKARGLSQLQPFHQFAVSDRYEGSVGGLTFQGYDIDEQLVYYYGDMGYLEVDPSKAYVSVLDKNGFFSARKEMAAIADVEKLDEFGMTDCGYMKAEGIKAKNDTPYLGFASRKMEGKDDRHLANILIRRNK